jgi:two-component system chemotaxis sensor kinase CheA
VAFKNPATGQLEPERRAVGIDRRSVDLLSDGTPNPAADRRTGKERRAPNAAVNVVVLSAGNLRYGLIVSQFLDSEEIVVKPLGAHLAQCQTYAGTTIRGDGTVALILDVTGIAAVANLSSTKALIENVESRQGTKQLDHDAQTYMVVENAPGELFGVPLGLVSRIERIRRENVVRAGGRTTITQGNRMVAMLAIEDVAKVGPRPDAPAFFAIICKANGREFGVMVSRIVDVQDGTAPIDAARHPGLHHHCGPAAAPAGRPRPGGHAVA